MARTSDPHAKVKLLAAAEAVFVEKGLDRAKVEDITARAGLSKGAFYLHFATKEDAFKQLVESVAAGLAVKLEAACPTPAQQAVMYSQATRNISGFLDVWLQLDVDIFEYLWANRGLMRVLLDGGGSLAYRHFIDDFAERSRKNLFGYLKAGVEKGVYRADLDVEVASLFLAGAYDRLAREVVRAPRKPAFPRLLKAAQRLVVSGVGGPPILQHFARSADHRVTQGPATKPRRRGPARARAGAR